MTRIHVTHVPAPGTQLEVQGDEAHHLTRVVRAGVGDVVRVFDGAGTEWQARVVSIGRQSAVLAIDRVVASVAEPAVIVTLGIAVLKGDQMDTVIRDATVMGASVIVPLATDHVTVPARAWRDDAAGRRWRRVAIAAAKQCGRAVVPEIAAVTPFARVAELSRPAMTLACLEPSAAGPETIRALDWKTLPRPASALLLIGPEGGWSPAETAGMVAQATHPLSLGPRTLRAESAPAVALTLLWATWGWT
jgi:16S rRNA (uracil1498-N3)-methyltransferase